MTVGQPRSADGQYPLCTGRQRVDDDNTNNSNNNNKQQEWWMIRHNVEDHRKRARQIAAHPVA